MDYLQQLLKDQKVEWKKLGEVCEVQRGASPRPIAQYLTDDKENGIPWIKIGDTRVGDKYIMDTQERITQEGAKKSRLLQKGDFVLSNSMSYGRPYILGISGCIHDGWASLSEISDTILPDFLYYYLSSNEVQRYWEGKINSGSVSNLNADIIKKLPIPLPPLSVQSRIVEILDKFTSLEAELEAELELRKKQYQHYREQLLNFSSTPPHEFNVIWRKLGEVAEIGTGRSNREDEVTDGAYPFYVRSKNILRSSTYQFDETAIVIPGEGGIGDIYHYVVGKYALHQRAYRIKLNSEEKIVPKFVYYYMTSAFKRYIISKSVGATATSIRKPMIEGFPIPIPPLSEQARIVEILDKFDALTNSITEGLPLEIKLRKQQYEYYREQLLDFRRF